MSLGSLLKNGDLFIMPVGAANICSTQHAYVFWVGAVPSTVRIYHGGETVILRSGCGGSMDPGGRWDRCARWGVLAACDGAKGGRARSVRAAERGALAPSRGTSPSMFGTPKKETRTGTESPWSLEGVLNFWVL